MASNSVRSVESYSPPTDFRIRLDRTGRLSTLHRAANRDGLAAQIRIIALLYGRIECIDMDDLAMGRRRGAFPWIRWGHSQTIEDRGQLVASVKRGAPFAERAKRSARFRKISAALSRVRPDRILRTTYL